MTTCAGLAPGAAALAPTAGASELAPLPRVTTPRLYVFDCGTLIYNRPEDYNLKREEVKDSNMGVTIMAAYCIIAFFDIPWSWAFVISRVTFAGDESRTRTISLGSICRCRRATW